MTWEGINQLCDVVRETSFATHKYHRTGHLEKVYENVPAHRLKTGLLVNFGAAKLHVKEYLMTVNEH